VFASNQIKKAEAVNSSAHGCMAEKHEKCPSEV
jgi:hypothetical protein